MRPKRKNLLKEIEKHFKAYIFARDERERPGYCRFDGCSNPKQCWFHFVRQSRSLKMKFDERNVIYSCKMHNAKMEGGEGWAWAWYIDKFGAQQMGDLERESHGRALWGIKELEEMASYWQQKYLEIATGMKGMPYMEAGR